MSQGYHVNAAGSACELQACPYTNDGECDEGTYCAVGTDTADCGSSSGSGGCPQAHAHRVTVGGSSRCTCEDGYDVNAAGTACELQTCRYTEDGECDEGTYCAVGTDTVDCANHPATNSGESGGCPAHAHASNGRCACDTGYAVNAAGSACEQTCATAGNGVCDEGTSCTPGTDSGDCVKPVKTCPQHAHVAAGGGSCTWDDGYCPSVSDGVCDEGLLCGLGTDTADCAHATAVLATTPAALTVAGLVCHTNANGAYTLATSLLNDKPHYVAVTGEFQLYWGTVTGYDGWMIDADLDSSSQTGLVAILYGQQEAPASGSWEEVCGQSTASRALAITVELSADNCLSRATSVVAGPACVEDDEAQCSIECAEQWLTAVETCVVHSDVFDASQSSICRETIALALRTAPTSVAVSGLLCHPGANGQYSLQDITRNGRPHYATRDGMFYLYSSFVSGTGAMVSNSQIAREVLSSRWFIGADTDDGNGYQADIETRSATPPTGRDGSWNENCQGSFDYVEVSISEVLSDENCAALATAVLESTACFASARSCGAGAGECDLACAEAWLPIVERCADHRVAFSGHQQLTASCEATSRVALATLPSTVTVTGSCSRGANAVYDLQPVSLNGRAVYATSDLSYFIYWTPAFGISNTPQWLIDTNTDDEDSMGRLASSSQRLPIVINGQVIPAYWWLNCPGQASHAASVAIEPGHTKDWCNTALTDLAPSLTNVCCGPDDGIDCGQAGQVPHACSLDCAQLLAPFSSQCPGLITQLGTLSDFLVQTCGPVIAGLTVASDTTVIQVNDFHSVPFDASAGTRYEITLRVGVGSGQASACRSNFYDLNHGDGSCDSMVRTGEFSCANDLAPGLAWEHSCDRTCGFTCSENGVRATKLIVHAPSLHLDPTSPGITSESTAIPDKTLSFTAAATGRYNALTIADGGSGPVMTTVTAVGTALGRSPPLFADGEPHPLRVLCETNDCTFHYAGVPAVDGDGRSFDLHLEVEAGISYSLEIDRISGGADVQATFYQPDAAESARGFADVLNGALGNWAPTPPGHHSIATHFSCDNADRACIASWLGHPFGIHPGAVFGNSLRGNFVAPASGPVLLRLSINCQVPFFSDVELEGCTVGTEGSDSYGCESKELKSCISDLTLTVTPGAHFTVDQEESSTEIDAQVDVMLPSPGPSQSVSQIVIGRTEIEAQAAAMLRQQPDPALSAAPTLDEMLVGGSEANALLQSMLTQEQQPHLVYPVQIDLAALDSGGKGGGHRRLQSAGDSLSHARDSHVTVTLVTRAPTRLDAERAITATAMRRGAALIGSGRRLQDCSPPPPAPVPPPPAVVPPPSTFQAPVVPIAVESSTVCGLGEGAAADFQGCTVAGQTQRVDTVQISRSEVEAQAASMLAATPPEQRMLATPPSLEEMMAGESEGSALLASMFVEQTPPRRVYPIALQPVTSAEMAAVNPAAASGSEGAAQAGAMLRVNGVSATIVSVAPTQEEATAVQEEMHAQAAAMFGPGVVVIDASSATGSSSTSTQGKGR
eukprot:COSAG06_NODE_418_length_15982_cov_3.455204_7_plen_1527_part_00